MNIMHTIASKARTKDPKRRFYSSELKLQVVAQCGQPRASIAAVALNHGINANIVHRWLREHAQGTLARPTQAFLPVALHEVAHQQAAVAPVSPAQIRVEVQRANATVIVHWPVQDAGSCTQWLREWLA